MLLNKAKRRFKIVTLLLLINLLIFSSQSQISQALTLVNGQPILFKETGHTLAYNFRFYWENMGGLEIFGYPLTEVLMEDGRPVQYFERSRLEWHADLVLVQAGLLGRWVTDNREIEHPFQPVVPALIDHTYYFTETKHNLRFGFLQFWQSKGGLATFGFPISEEFEEINQEDGRKYTVQYFERARFEFHPELPSGQQVVLGHLGRLFLQQKKSIPVQALMPVADQNAAWKGIRPTMIEIPRISLKTEIVEGGFSLQGWDVPRYTAVHYWPVSGFPGSSGNIILAGHAGFRFTIFDTLPQVKTGDEVIISMALMKRNYKVTEITVTSSFDTSSMTPSEKEILTLITCVPPNIFDKRLIVRAVPLEPV
jgi:LPXTG-site transpeptidase (sortase) family protein